jgi:4,5-dihydroxyphthalate decarboxylase
MSATMNATMSADRLTTLNVAFDDYPQTLALKRGEVKSDRVALKFSDIKPANRFFKPMVRELKFDISEMAIATYLQAKAYGKPLILLPATIMGRFQHNTIVYNAARGVLTPADLPGKRVGVRSYSQTTITWVRGILANDYGIDVDRIHWVSQEDGHVAEYKEPPEVERAPPQKDLLQMLRDGEVDAAIYGANLPNDPNLKSVIPDPDAAAAKWYAQHKAVPINHMVVVTETLSRSDPEAVREVFRLLLASKRAAGLPKPGGIDFLPFGFDACRPTLEIMIKYTLQQKLVPRPLDVEELFDATTRNLAP